MSAHICSQDECERTVIARGLCRMHYLRAHRAGTLDEHQTGHHECPSDHPHTWETCWKEHGCKCPRCQHDRAMDRQRRRNRLRAYGQEDKIREERVPSAPAAAHVAELIASAPVGLERIADAAGVSRNILLDLKFGSRGKNPGKRPTTLKKRDADRILALRVEHISLVRVPALGTMRRLRALVAIGWTHTQLAQMLGRKVTNLWKITSGWHDIVTAVTAEQVAALYDECWDRPQHVPYSDAARRAAARRGWVGPLAWDDIDTDPEPPAVEAPAQSKGERILEDVEWLLDAGEPVEQIIATLQRSASSIAKLAERHGRPDLRRHFDSLKNHERNAA